MGRWAVVHRFGQLADAQAKTFDDLVVAAPDLWAEARSVLPAELRDARCCAIFGGWSEKSERLQLHLIMASGKLYADAVAFAAGPTESCAELVGPFVERFRADPDTFDARRDAIKVMDGMRRHRKQFERAMRPAIGGFIQHATLTRTGVVSEVIYRWPSDRVGHPIEIAADSALGADGSETPIRAGAEYTWVGEDGWVSWNNGRLTVLDVPAEVMEFLRRSNPELAARHETPPAETSR